MERNTKLTKNDLPVEVVEKMEKAIREDPQIVKLEERRLQLIRQRCYVQANKIKSDINCIVNRVINDYLAHYEGEVVRMDELLKDMSDEDREEINILSNSIMMLCDMIESFTMDCNAILHKYHPDFNIEMYDKMESLGKEAKAQMDFMAKHTDIIYQCTFADSADDITELVRNKAKSLIRKLNHKKNEANR